MTYRDTRLQAAIVRGHEILVVEMLVDDGRRFWLLAGGGHERSDVDESAAIAREVREETTAAVSVERLLIEAPAHPDDATYRRYRTFLCHPIAGSEPVAGARDGIATICAVRWLHLDDEASWGRHIAEDRFLYPQLRAIRAALAAPTETTSKSTGHCGGARCARIS